MHLEKRRGIPFPIRPVVTPEVCWGNLCVPSNETFGMLLGRWRQEGADDEVQLWEDEEDEQDLLHSRHPLHPHDSQGQDADQADTSNQPNIMDPWKD